MRESTWFEDLRAKYRPDAVRVLLVGESAPEPGAGDRRFFYAPVLARHDNLFRAVVEAFYRRSPGSAGDEKTPWLERLTNDGVFLIDLVPFPVNRLSLDKTEARRLREQAGADHAADCVAAAVRLDPDGVIICHAWRIQRRRCRHEGRAASRPA